METVAKFLAISENKWEYSQLEPRELIKGEIGVAQFELSFSNKKSFR